MRFTVVATGQFSLRRAFGFGLAASSRTPLSVVNSPIRPAGLPPAWHPASPAHTRNPKWESRPERGCPQPQRVGRTSGRKTFGPLRRAQPLRLRTAALRPSGYFGIRVQSTRRSPPSRQKSPAQLRSRGAWNFDLAAYFAPGAWNGAPAHAALLFVLRPPLRLYSVFFFKPTALT